MNTKAGQYFQFLLVMLIVACNPAKQSTLEQEAGATKPALDVRLQSRLVEVDHLGQLYVADQKNRIVRLSPMLKEMYSYANNRQGQVTGLDASNPLQILAFYDDFNQIKVLDNTLSLIWEMSLESISPDISACGNSNDGNIWVFDPVRLRLVKVNREGTIINETSNLADVGMAGCQISAIREKANVVLLCDPSRGFYFFDNLGQYQYHFQASDILAFQFDGRFITYYTPTGLKRYSLVFKDRTLLGYPLDLAHPTMKYILMNKDGFYAVYGDGILRRPANGKD